MLKLKPCSVLAARRALHTFATVHSESTCTCEEAARNTNEVKVRVDSATGGVRILRNDTTVDENSDYDLPA